MDSQFKTSFIPKKPIDTSVDLTAARPSSRGFGRTIFSLVGTFVFLATLAALAGTFVWQMKLNAQIDSQQKSLQKAKEEFDERFVQDAFRLDTRINEGDSILQNHVSPSSLYALLEENTLQTVSFSGFTFTDNKDGTLTVRGTGDARWYESIVLQSDQFGRSGYMRNVIFTDLRPATDASSVSFAFEATLDPTVVLYRMSLPEITNEQQ